MSSPEEKSELSLIVFWVVDATKESHCDAETRRELHKRQISILLAIEPKSPQPYGWSMKASESEVRSDQTLNRCSTELWDLNA